MPGTRENVDTEKLKTKSKHGPTKTFTNKGSLVHFFLFDRN
jgi:hypothetical protein